MMNLKLAFAALVGNAITINAATPYLPFLPETYSAEGVFDTRYPTLFNGTESQIDPPSTSWWSSSYLTLSNNHQYAVISHALLYANTPAITRTSIFDITTTNLYYSNVTYSNLSSIVTDGKLNIVAPDGSFVFQGLSNDSVSVMRTYASLANYSYDLTFEATTEPLLNMGIGTFEFGANTTTEWGLPNCRTTGSVMVGGQNLTVDPAHSYTWYDRQYGSGGPSGNWTWFELHFPASDIKLSAWAIDSSTPNPGTKWRTATARTPAGMLLIPFTFTPDYSETWTSPQSNTTYALRWTLDFKNGDSITIASAKPDQEMYGPAGPSSTAYEGIVTFEGSFLGQSTGWGLVEMTSAA